MKTFLLTVRSCIRVFWPAGHFNAYHRCPQALVSAKQGAEKGAGD